MDQIPDDLTWYVLTHFVHDFQDICTIRATNHALHDIIRIMDRHVGLWYVEYHLGDPQFWQRARERPRVTSKPLSSFHAECVRMEVIRRGFPNVTAQDFYEIWKYIDRT